MTDAEFKALLKQQLPILLQQDLEIRALVLQTVSDYFAGRQETASRFDRILDELQRDREAQDRKWEAQDRKWDEFQQAQARKWDEQANKWEEQNRKWDEFQQAQARKWDEQANKWEEQNRKWDEFQQAQARKWDEQANKWEEQNRKWDEFQQAQARKWEANQKRQDQIMEEIRAMNRKHDSTLGALGARWGLRAEASFRSALKGILEASFGVEVLNVVEYDDTGEVFGRPEQVELDLIIKNGDLMICEIKSSISKPDLYAFDRKAAFYEKRHQRQASRKMIISPMVHPQAQPIAPRLGIEIYSYAEDVPLDPQSGSEESSAGRSES
jgi:hypothetical protein